MQADLVQLEGLGLQDPLVSQDSQDSQDPVVLQDNLDHLGGPDNPEHPDCKVKMFITFISLLNNSCSLSWMVSYVKRQFSEITA